MNKVILTGIAIFISSTIYSQVDSMKIYSENSDSVKIIVYTTFPSCYLVDSVNYLEQGDSLKFSFYYSEEFPQCECLNCQHQNLFVVERDQYIKIIFNAMIRNCIENCTSYSDYILYASDYFFFSGVGTIEFQNNKEVRIYPNPAENILHIQFTEGVESMQVFDICGRCIKSNTLNSSGDIQIDISSLSPSTYLLKVISNNRQDNFKFLKTY